MSYGDFSGLGSRGGDETGGEFWQFAVWLGWLASTFLSSWDKVSCQKITKHKRLSSSKLLSFCLFFSEFFG